MVKMFTVSSITCDTKITNKNNTPKGCRFCVCRSDVFASKLKFIEFVYKYNTPIPDSNPKLNVVWQNKDGGSPKVPHSQIWDLLTSRHDSSRGVVNWISCASSGALSRSTKNSRNSRWRSEWHRHFLEFQFESLGVPREVGLKFRKVGISGKFRSIRPLLLGPSFSGPRYRIQHV